MVILILVFFYCCTLDRGCVGLEDNIVSCLKAEVHNPEIETKTAVNKNDTCM